MVPLVNPFDTFRLLWISFLYTSKIISDNSSAEINGLSLRRSFAVAHSNELFNPTVPGTEILNFVTFKPLGGYILLGVVSTLFGLEFSAVQTPP